MNPSLLVLLGALQGCRAEGELPTTRLALEGVALVVEVADSEAERSQGLMYRESLASGRGMLFVYPRAEPRSFWMENTRIPLSIAFLDARGCVVSMADMRPLDRSHTRSGFPARWALEVNRGWFEAHGVKVGDCVNGLPEGTEP